MSIDDETNQKIKASQKGSLSAGPHDDDDDEEEEIDEEEHEHENQVEQDTAADSPNENENNDDGKNNGDAVQLPDTSVEKQVGQTEDGDAIMGVDRSGRDDLLQQEFQQADKNANEKNKENDNNADQNDDDIINLEDLPQNKYKKKNNNNASPSSKQPHVDPMAGLASDDEQKEQQAEKGDEVENQEQASSSVDVDITPEPPRQDDQGEDETNNKNDNNQDPDFTIEEDSTPSPASRNHKSLEFTPATAQITSSSPTPPPQSHAKNQQQQEENNKNSNNDQQQQEAEADDNVVASPLTPAERSQTATKFSLSISNNIEVEGNNNNNSGRHTPPEGASRTSTARPSVESQNNNNNNQNQNQNDNDDANDNDEEDEWAQANAAFNNNNPALTPMHGSPQNQFSPPLPSANQASPMLASGSLPRVVRKNSSSFNNSTNNNNSASSSSTTGLLQVRWQTMQKILLSDAELIAGPTEGSGVDDNESICNVLCSCLMSKSNAERDLPLLMMMAKIPMAHNNPNHENLMKSIRVALHQLTLQQQQLDNSAGVSSSSSSVLPSYDSLGFQSNDPANDLRGTGMLGLLQWYYLIKRHPELAAPMWRDARSDTHAFQFALASFEMTAMVLAVMRTGQLNDLVDDRERVVIAAQKEDAKKNNSNGMNLQSPASNHSNTSNSSNLPPERGVILMLFAHDLYCGLMRHFYRVWKSAPTRQVMDFPPIRTLLKKIVASDPVSILFSSPPIPLAPTTFAAGTPARPSSMSSHSNHTSNIDPVLSSNATRSSRRPQQQQQQSSNLNSNNNRNKTSSGGRRNSSNINNKYAAAAASTTNGDSNGTATGSPMKLPPKKKEFSMAAAAADSKDDEGFSSI